MNNYNKWPMIDLTVKSLIQLSYLVISLVPKNTFVLNNDINIDLLSAILVFQSILNLQYYVSKLYLLYFESNKVINVNDINNTLIVNFIMSFLAHIEFILNVCINGNHNHIGYPLLTLLSYILLFHTKKTLSNYNMKFNINENICDFTNVNNLLNYVENIKKQNMTEQNMTEQNMV